MKIIYSAFYPCVAFNWTDSFDSFPQLDSRHLRSFSSAMWLKAFIVSFCLHLAVALIAEHKNCANVPNQATDIQADLVGCENPRNCSICLGKKQQVIITFTSSVNTAGLKRSLWAMISGVQIPYKRSLDICPDTWTLDKETSCQDTNGIRAGESYCYMFLFPISRHFPVISLNVKMSLDSDDIRVLCIEVPITLVKCENQ